MSSRSDLLYWYKIRSVWFYTRNVSRVSLARATSILNNRELSSSLTCWFYNRYCYVVRCRMQFYTMPTQRRNENVEKNLTDRLLHCFFFVLFFTDNETTIRLRRRRRRWWGQIAEGIIRSYTLLAFIFWKSIMPVGGRVAGKGVGVHNSGGSSDGNDIITII